jgi:hypothetical protein
VLGSKAESDQPDPVGTQPQNDSEDGGRQFMMPNTDSSK